MKVHATALTSALFFVLQLFMSFETMHSHTTLQLLPYHHVKQRHLLEKGHLPDDSSLDISPDHEPYSRHDINSKFQTRRDLRTSQIASLYQGYGTHFVDLWIGTPSVRQTVIVDTGSGVTAFPCTGCNNCGSSYHTDGYFDPFSSSTFHLLQCSECQRGSCQNHHQCNIEMSYAEGSSWSANESSDTVYAGGFHEKAVKLEEHDDNVERDGTDPNMAREYSFKLNFGCMTENSGLFRSQLADGIMGMSNIDDQVFWRQMYRQQQIDKARFSLCFSRELTLGEFGKNAGAMTLGGTDERLHLNPMGFMNYRDSFGFYGVYVQKIYVHTGGGDRFGIDIDLNEGETISVDVSANAINEHAVIMDSGTTDTCKFCIVHHSESKSYNLPLFNYILQKI